jgi:hypothetical protein
MNGTRYRRDQGARTTGESVAWRRDVVGYVVLSTAALGCVLILGPSSGASFGRFFGSVEPALVVIAASVAGAVALGWLRSRFGFRVLLGRGTLRGMAVAAGLATFFAAAVVVADTLLRYPEDMNVPLPQALAFYPTVGYVAELVFHVLPLAVTLLVLSPFRGRLGTDRLAWLAIGLVAALEPTFQVLFGEDRLSTIAVYTWVHVYMISLLQLAVFRRYDFVSMVTLRLVYYAYWHVAWGTLRLDVLF